jgi:putative peptidoglycan lipid II flippase
MASLSLMAYIFGLPAFILIKIYAPGYYARQDTRTPVRIGIIAMVSNMVMNIAFVIPLLMHGYEAPHVGLALATSCSAYLNAFLLYRGLRNAEVFQPNVGWSKLLVQITFGVTCMVGALIYVTPELQQWSDWSVITRITWLAGIISFAVFIYFFALMLIGLRPGQLKRS